MKWLRYFFRGLREVARDLGLIKRVVRPKSVPPPHMGNLASVLRYIARVHGFRSVVLFDSEGKPVATVGSRNPDAVDAVLPLMDMRVPYAFVKVGDDWVTLFGHRDLVFVLVSPFKPDVVDLWVLGRDFDRYMWGILWED